MMIEPGISELQKSVDSRYTLVVMAAKRARMLGTKTGEDAVQKPVSDAVREIADGKVGYVRRSRNDGIIADKSLDISNGTFEVLNLDAQ